MEEEAAFVAWQQKQEEFFEKKLQESGLLAITGAD